MIDDPREPDHEQDPTAVTTDDKAFGDEHPLSSPSELAGTADAAIEAEFAARDALADAEGAAWGIDYEEDTLPLEGN